MKNSSKLKLTQKTLMLLGVGLVSQLANADITHNDDVIIEGSVCTSDGSFCANGENFTNSSQIAEIKLKDNIPNIWFNDNDAGDADWQIIVDHQSAEDFRIHNVEVGVAPFIIENGVSTLGMLTIDSGERVGVGTSAPGETLEVASLQPAIRLNDTNGGRVDFEMDANLFSIQENTNRNRFVIETNGTAASTNQLYLNNDGNVGIQVANPSLDLVVGGGGLLGLSGTADLRIEAGANFTNFTHSLTDTGSGGFFKIRDGAPANSLTIESDGKIGMGTFSAAADLHVRRAGADIRVEDTVVGGSQVLMELQKNGIPAFRLTNTGNASSWDFTQRTNKNFTLSKAGSGGFEMQITPTGDVFARGDVYAQGIMLTSSRSAKTDFAEIKTSDVMKKLAEINVEEWSYKGKKDRHISPMAEDFYSLFQLGPDNKHINPNDLASVAIIAAKELQAQTALLKAENETLKQQLKEKTLSMQSSNDKLQQRLASLEKLVTNLASSDGHLMANGKKVAMNK